MPIFCEPGRAARCGLSLSLLLALSILPACHTSKPITPPIEATPAAGLTAPALTISPEAEPVWPEQGAALLSTFAGDLAGLGPVPRYDLRVEVFPEQSQLAGRLHLEYTNREAVPLDRLMFWLFPNLPERGGSSVVQDVHVNGQPAAFAYQADDILLEVRLSQPLPAGESLVTEMTFRVDIPLMAEAGYQEFVNQDGILALPGFYPSLAVHDANGWDLDIPIALGDAMFADVALFRLTLTVPENMIVASTGQTTEQSTESARRRKTLQIVSGPARELNIVMSHEFQAAVRQAGPVTVRSYFRPGDRTVGEQVARVAADALTFYGDQFGAYPYTELDLAQTSTAAGGIEYPGLIVLNRNYYQGDSSGRVDWVVRHEVIHQWFYGLVGNDPFDEPWLDEALTNYVTWLYYEWKGDSALAHTLLTQVFKEPADAAREKGFDGSIGLPVDGYTEASYGPVVYSNGPLFFHALRERIGDEAFRTLLRTYADRNRYSIANGQSFLDLAEEIAGQQMDDLYAEWELPQP